MVNCSKCDALLPEDLVKAGKAGPCPSCGGMVRVEAFPALMQDPVVLSEPDRPAEEGEAGCFYHPPKRAVTPCPSCGRFLCSLCDIDFAGTRTCPACLEKAYRNQELEAFITRRTLYDQIALMLAFMPLLFMFYPSIITVPAAMYVIVRFSREPGSLVRGKKLRFILAVFFILVHAVLWLLVFFG